MKQTQVRYFFKYNFFNTFYDNRVQNGTKDLFHIEALIAKLMYIQAKIN